ncbi:MAG: DUF4129 domain-containing protein [Euryarchaeota archaeon]|nr:DUF4129 domain-containing protein [Euryarchaeota archaeon]
MMVLFILIALNLGNVHLSYAAMPVPHHSMEQNPEGPGVHYMSGTTIALAIELGIFAAGIVGIILLALKYGKKYVLGLLLYLVFGVIMAAGVGLIIGYGLQWAAKIATSGGNHVDVGSQIPLGAILFYVAVSLFLLLITLVILKSVKLKKEKEETPENISKYVERAISTIKIGGDVRGAILRAYKEMEHMMRARGVVDKEYFTPREFKDFALNKLKLSSEPVNVLVRLFEVARYSNHEMEESQRTAALKALEEIRDELQENND